MTDDRRRPIYLAEALEKVLAPAHDKYLVAAGAYLYPKTIQNILSRKPVSQTTLEKVERALKRGDLSPKRPPAVLSIDCIGSSCWCEEQPKPRHI